MRKCKLCLILGMLLCAVYLLTACETDTVVKIVYKDSVDAEAAICAMTDTIPEENFSEQGAAPHVQQAQALLEDPKFSEYLEAYRTQGYDEETALAAAILAYMYAETGVVEIPDMEEENTSAFAEEASPTAESLLSDDTVYYTPNGSVWHISRDCSSLKHSENVLSGTVDDAEQAGKASACRRCVQ